MYKVMLADDEPSAIESMKEHIEWAKYDMEVIHCVNSGKDALAILEKDTPDIAILDIRMPGFSGLDLSKYIFKNSLKTKVIIVSGYAEFSYAQKAIQYGVLGYCLKPVEYEEIETLLLKAAHSLSEKTSDISQDDFLEAIEANDHDSITAYIESNGLKADNLYITVVSGEPVIKDDSLCFKVGNNLFGYISNNAPNIEFCKHLCEENPQLGIAVYPSKADVSKLRSYLFRTVAMSYHSFIEPGENFCDFHFPQSSFGIYKRIQDAVSFSEKDKLIGLLKELKEDDEKIRYSIHDAEHLYNLVITNPKFVEDSEDRYIYSFRQLVNQFSNFDMMLDDMIDLLGMGEVNVDASSDLSNFYFLKIMKYINTYYKDDISLKDVAGVVNLNPNYISQVFKKATGTTFSHYLTNLRITNAEKLLKSSDESINEISIQSGFNDYFYFLKTFKKYTGFTPSEYRKNAGI